MEQVAEEISKEESPKVGVQCVNSTCAYRWKTRTKLRYISCPNCRHTNKVADAVKAYEENCG